jgi:hypothetical protein
MDDFDFLLIFVSLLIFTVLDIGTIYPHPHPHPHHIIIIIIINRGKIGKR